MSNENYKALISAMVQDRAKEIGTSDKSEAFESIVNNLVLDTYDLGVDEIEAGITEGSGDGQIDAMYIIVNGISLIREDNDDISPKGPLEIDVVFIQAKHVYSF